MSLVLFPAGLNLNLHNLNMEEMEFYARAWNLERIQIQRGLYLGSLKVTHTPRMQLMSTSHSHGLMMRGDFPKGTILITFITTKADITFKNKIANRYEVKILKSGDEIDFLCNGESVTFTIAVQEQYFNEAYYAYFGQNFNTNKKDKKIHIHPQSFPRFIHGFEQWMHYLMQDHSQLQIEKHYEKIESEILEHVFSYIYLDDSNKLRQKFQIKKARDLLHQSVKGSNNIVDLSQELGISERLLHQAFKQNYGVTPKKYLLSLRMHKVKQDLLLADPNTTTISSVIEKYHFFNQSTFTQAYKQMFEELPSERFKKSL